MNVYKQRNAYKYSVLYQKSKKLLNQNALEKLVEKLKIKSNIKEKNVEKKIIFS